MKHLIKLLTGNAPRRVPFTPVLVCVGRLADSPAALRGTPKEQLTASTLHARFAHADLSVLHTLKGRVRE